MKYLHICCDYQVYTGFISCLNRIERKYIRDDVAYFDNHLEIGELASRKKVYVQGVCISNKQLIYDMDLHNAILSFIQDSDDMNLAEESLWKANNVDLMRKIDKARTECKKFCLWHNESAESKLALWYITEMINRTSGSSAQIRTGRFNEKQMIHIADGTASLTEYEDKVVREITTEIGTNMILRHMMLRSKTALENGNLRVLDQAGAMKSVYGYSYFDNAISDCVGESEFFPSEIVEVVHERTGLWKAFIIFRLQAMKDHGAFMVISSPKFLDASRPDFYGEKWKRTDGKNNSSDETFDYDGLQSLLHEDKESLHDQYQINYMLHHIPINNRSKDWLIESLNDENIADKRKAELVVCCLVRFCECIAQDEKKMLLSQYPRFANGER